MFRGGRHKPWHGRGFDKLSLTLRFRCQAELVEALLNRNNACLNAPWELTCWESASQNHTFLKKLISSLVHNQDFIVLIAYPVIND